MTATVSPKGRFRWAAAFPLVLLAAATSTLGQAAADSATRDRLSLLALLHSGSYAQLEAYLARLQDGFATGHTSEQIIDSSFAAFASADPALQSKLDAWIETYPESSAARLARGEYYRHLGRISLRNASLRKETTAEIAPADGFLAQARRDLQAAAKRRPRLGIIYAALIHVAASEGAMEEVDHWYDKGFESAAGSAALRRAYLLSLRPWYRPDEDPAELMAKLRALVDELPEGPETEAGLAALRGFEAYITAEALRRQRRHDQADKSYKAALAQGDDWLYLRGAGMNAFHRGRFVEALRQFSGALALRAQDPALLNWRARTLWSLGNAEAALSDWRLALSIDPGNPQILLGYARALQDSGRPEAALEALEAAAFVGQRNPRVRSLRGRLLLTALDQPKSAIVDLKYATELDPHSGEAWRAYAEALYRSKDCDSAVDALATYQRLCTNGARCSSADMSWAEEAIRGTRDPAICPAYGIVGP